MARPLPPRPRLRGRAGEGASLTLDRAPRACRPRPPPDPPPQAGEGEDALEPLAGGLLHRPPSTASMLFGVPADERVAVRHGHLRQGFGVHHVVLADDLVARENIGRECIDLVIG